MKTSFTSWHMLMWVAILVPAVYIAVVWSSVPEQVPVHWDLSGEADGYGSRESLPLLGVGLPLSIYLLMLFLPRFDPKHNLDAGSTNYQKLTLSLVLSFAALGCATTYAALHPATGTDAVLGSISLMFILMGNYLTTVQPNYFVGIRTPWTLENPIVWQRTHRLGGRLFVLIGAIGLVACAVAPPAVSNPIVAGGIFFVVVIVFVYSIVASRQEANRLKA